MGRKEELVGKGVRECLVKFHKDYYAKAEVSFVIYSSLSMEENNML